MKLNDQENIVKEETKKVSKKVTSTKSVGAEIEVTEENLDKLIPIWKEQFGRIYKNIIDGETVIWRPIRRKEYRELLDFEASEEENRLLAKQEATVKTAVLFPKDVEVLIEAKAGFATVLSEEILAYSGFDISETESL